MKKYDKSHLKTAFIWAEESKCKRLKVGAVIAKDGRIISIGFNGTPEGFKKSIKIPCEKCNGTGYIKEEYNTINALPKNNGHLAAFRDVVCPECSGYGHIIVKKSDNNCELIIKKCSECNFTFENFFECKLEKTGEYSYYLCPECGKTLAIYDENNRIYSGYLQEAITNPNVIHAEMNALMFAAKRGLSTDGATLYVTHAPCINCAKHILQSGIKRVVYSEEYRDLSGVELLKSMIEVEQIPKKDIYEN